MIKEIEKLNREIDRIMTEKTKADAQKEVWESRLAESLNNYNKEYGVNLSGKDLVEIKKKLMAETNIVEAKTKEEFKLSQKIVNLINEGDIKGAWKVLGVDIDAVNNQANEEPQEKVEEPSKPQVGQKVQGATQVVGEMDDEDFFGESFDDEEEFVEPQVQEETKPQPQVNKPAKEKTFIPFMLEDDDEEDEFISPSTTEISNDTDNGSFVVEDEEEDDFGGFGNILEGSKFQV